MTDGINAGEESDRLLIRWELDSADADAAAANRALEPDVDKLREWGCAAILSVGKTGEPVIEPASARVLLCQVPDDIVAIRRSDQAMAHEWRKALRGALGGSLGLGYAIKGATRSGWYVLEKQ
jgi:predicted GNAT superfamily acetyltransferase